MQPARSDVKCSGWRSRRSTATRRTASCSPRGLRELRRRMTVALRRAFFDFSRSSTTHRPAHFHALGRRAVVKAVWDVDRMLADVSESFDFLLQVTPVNGEQAWHEFKRKSSSVRRRFTIGRCPPSRWFSNAALYKAPVERIEDPALAMIFREKLDDIDRQITMLQDRNTPRFLHESIQLYGGGGGRSPRPGAADSGRDPAEEPGRRGRRPDRRRAVRRAGARGDRALPAARRERRWRRSRCAPTSPV